MKLLLRLLVFTMLTYNISAGICSSNTSETSKDNTTSRKNNTKDKKTTIAKTRSPIGQITTTTHQQTAFQPTKAKQ